MALPSVPHPLGRSSAVEKGTQIRFVMNSTLGSSQNKLSPNSSAFLRVSGQANVSSGFWANDRQSQLEVFRFRTKRRALVFESGAAAPGLSPVALQGGERAPRRLVDFVKAIPRISRAYFKSPFRRALYGGISLLGGFYAAQTISLSFGALGVNDVIAAALCVLLAEYVTKYYHTRRKMTFSVALLNNFKMGFTYGLFIDAFKLAS